MLSLIHISRLKISPCRYTGSAYTNNLIIAAHNYKSHFRKLKHLHAGDIVTFMDMDRNVFHYEVVESEILKPTTIDKMESGDWDLTLFTCTIGGRSRVVVPVSYTHLPMAASSRLACFETIAGFLPPSSRMTGRT